MTCVTSLIRWLKPSFGAGNGAATPVVFEMADPLPCAGAETGIEAASGVPVFGVVWVGVGDD